MNGSRLTTSFEVETKIIELQKLLKLSTKAAVIRIAFGISINEKKDPREIYSDISNDHSGSTYQRATITGEHDELYKALIIQQLDKDIEEKDIFPELFNSHISRGIDILYNEYRLVGNYEKIVDYLFKKM
ncbi:MAG: DndE family protein [Bacilli bacterium]|nr:DndE family protein [Bacilli bacterium]